jgi:hypothetical protein
MTAVALVLALCGVVLTAVGLLRSYAVARQAIAPLIHQGDPTRAAIEALRPLLLRPKVRTVASRAMVSMGWLAVSLYGLYLVVRASAVAA